MAIFKEEWVYNPKVEVLLYFDEEGKDVYEIDIERVKGSAGVLDWISQVHKKSWATQKCLKGLLDAFDYLGDDLQNNFCGGEKDKPNARMIEITRRHEFSWRFFPMPKYPGKNVSPYGGVNVFDLHKEWLSNETDWAVKSEARAREAGLIEDED